MKHQITITIDTDALQGYTDRHLATLWHVAQANPVDGFSSSEPGDLAERIGRDIIRRFLASASPALWDHQGRHFPQGQLMELRKQQAARPIPQAGAEGMGVFNEPGKA